MKSSQNVSTVAHNKRLYFHLSKVLST